MDDSPQMTSLSSLEVPSLYLGECEWAGRSRAEITEPPTLAVTGTKGEQLMEGVS